MITNKQAPMTMNQHAKTEELLEAVFSVVCAMVITMQRCNNHVSAATMEELLEAVFAAWSMPSGYEWDKFRTESDVRKAGSYMGVYEEKIQLKNTHS
jgi:hypothetical protein